MCLHMHKDKGWGLTGALTPPPHNVDGTLDTDLVDQHTCGPSGRSSRPKTCKYSWFVSSWKVVLVRLGRRKLKVTAVTE